MKSIFKRIIGMVWYGMVGHVARAIIRQTSYLRIYIGETLDNLADRMV
jgi:hypothetical protein